MGRGKDLTEREKKYQSTCCMCGLLILAVRPNKESCSIRCRTARRRWKALYGCDPIKYPGHRGFTPSYWNRAQWYRTYLPLNHPLNVKFSPHLQETPKKPKPSRSPDKFGNKRRAKAQRA